MQDTRKYLVYGYYCHSPKFLARFEQWNDAQKFIEEHKIKEANNPQFEMCYTEVAQ